MSQDPNKPKTSLLATFKYALVGIVNTVKHERSFRIELVVAAFALAAAWVLKLEAVEWALVIVLIVIVLALELVNSALESFIDLASPAVNPLAKYAKDAMAAAVLVAALGALAGGLCLYISAACRLWC